MLRQSTNPTPNDTLRLKIKEDVAKNPTIRYATAEPIIAGTV